MNEKITIVTAFFPLNRDKWEGFNRSNDKYYKYFEFWSRIQNDMIIYTDKDSAEIINNIRTKRFDRKNTKIITIDDYSLIDSELYNSVKKATENQLNIDFHLYNKNPESWNANYNYIMLMKEWCIQDAIEKGYAKGMIAWVDFGFNHGGEYYTISDEFDFEWKYPFSDKMHFFSIHNPDDVPIFENIRLMSTYIQGCIIVGPDYLWRDLWSSVRTNMLFLNKIGLSDDDQIFLYLYYKEYPDKCELHKCEWFSQFEIFSDKKFTHTRIFEKTSFFKKIKNQINWRKTIHKYLKRWYKILIKEETKY